MTPALVCVIWKCACPCPGGHTHTVCANAIEEGGEQIAQIFAHVSTRDVTGVYFSEPFTRRIQPINPS